jgi:hypothetical protein
MILRNVNTVGNQQFVMPIRVTRRNMRRLTMILNASHVKNGYAEGIGESISRKILHFNLNDF